MTQGEADAAKLALAARTLIVTAAGTCEPLGHRNAATLLTVLETAGWLIKAEDKVQ